MKFTRQSVKRTSLYKVILSVFTILITLIVPSIAAAASEVTPTMDCKPAVLFLKGSGEG